MRTIILLGIVAILLVVGVAAYFEHNSQAWERVKAAFRRPAKVDVGEGEETVPEAPEPSSSDLKWGSPKSAAQPDNTVSDDEDYDLPVLPEGYEWYLERAFYANERDLGIRQTGKDFGYVETTFTLVALSTKKGMESAAKSVYNQYLRKVEQDEMAARVDRAAKKFNK